MIKHLKGECSYVIWPNPKKIRKSCILVERITNEPILTSTLAAGSVQDKFAGEAGEGEGGEVETTGGYFYSYCYL